VREDGSAEPPKVLRLKDMMMVVMCYSDTQIQDLLQQGCSDSKGK
jgi:hypothetical protein